MAELKLTVTLQVPEEFFDDDQYEYNIEYIGEELQSLADGIDGDVMLVEIMK